MDEAIEFTDERLWRGRAERKISLMDVNPTNSKPSSPVTPVDGTNARSPGPKKTSSTTSLTQGSPSGAVAAPIGTVAKKSSSTSQASTKSNVLPPLLNRDGKDITHSLPNSRKFLRSCLLRGKNPYSWRGKAFYDRQK